MYEEIRKQNDKFSSSAKYFATVNNKGFLHIYKMTLGNNKLLLKRLRSTTNGVYNSKNFLTTTMKGENNNERLD